MLKPLAKIAKAIEKAIDRDNWMTAEEALEFGLLDKIVTSMKDVELLLKHSFTNIKARATILS